ncbi:alpha/beta fold hydrolase [Pseudonocardia nigra]|uniref:alpha/beta fold hydrolase n=1 Tax=Pseudonocardia nigra TaxID=1921578 RepID=UPI0027E24724|nr:alpha/beta fold hydrolase [Pseudonocardia nigra]
MTTVTAPDGTRIAYQIGGEGPPLLLLAGQAGSHRWWTGVRADFEAYRTTVTIDYRGMGESDKPDVPYSTQGFAADAVAVLDALGFERADVYGTSMGGRVAQWIAARHPERVHRLVLGCTSPGGEHGVERSAAVRKALAHPDPATSREALLDLMYTPQWRERHPGPYWTLGDPGMPRHARRRHLVASAEHDAWAALPQIVAPTLVLHGDADELNPFANARLLADRIPHARLEVLAGARHAYFEECRAEAGRLVREFLEAPQE